MNLGGQGSEDSALFTAPQAPEAVRERKGGFGFGSFLRGFCRGSLGLGGLGFKAEARGIKGAQHHSFPGGGCSVSLTVELHGLSCQMFFSIQGLRGESFRVVGLAVRGSSSAFHWFFVWFCCLSESCPVALVQFGGVRSSLGCIDRVVCAVALVL